MENPYQPAVDWIKRSPGTGGSNGLAKLILSLWNNNCAFSFRECVRSFDDTRSEWAAKIIIHFLQHGEDAYLKRAGKEVYDLCPYIWDWGYAGGEARRSWDREEYRERLETLDNED